MFIQKWITAMQMLKERISGFKDVDKFIENKNIICRYIKTNNPSSAIKADYLIKKYFI
mgnify:FL=1